MGDGSPSRRWWVDEVEDVEDGPASPRVGGDGESRAWGDWFLGRGPEGRVAISDSEEYSSSSSEVWRSVSPSPPGRRASRGLTPTSSRAPGWTRPHPLTNPRQLRARSRRPMFRRLAPSLPPFLRSHSTLRPLPPPRTRRRSLPLRRPRSHPRLPLPLLLWLPPGICPCLRQGGEVGR